MTNPLLQSCAALAQSEAPSVLESLRLADGAMREAVQEAQRLNRAAGETVFNPAVYQLLHGALRHVKASIETMEGRT